LLRRAKAAGQFRAAGSADRLRQDADFTALRGRADFEQLLKEIGAK
jgi:hypothetical protein